VVELLGHLSVYLYVITNAYFSLFSIPADTGLNSLSSVKTLYVGESGGKGQSKHCTGKNAEHTVVKVCGSLLLLTKSSNFVRSSSFSVLSQCASFQRGKMSTFRKLSELNFKVPITNVNRFSEVLSVM